ncbi:hypothetical protein Q5O14_15035 [Eubacteriaceae bacterium ES2]|nr:hypothetical protein Q5O14_15035 [Eubacteriaceae bacterium ES2]
MTRYIVRFKPVNGTGITFQFDVGAVSKAEALEKATIELDKRRMSIDYCLEEIYRFQ